MKEQEQKFPNSLNIEREDARSEIIEAFEQDPTLEIKGSGPLYWDLSVKYKNEFNEYREGDDGDLYIYYIPTEEEVLISQLFLNEGRVNSNPLRVFLDPDSEPKSPATYYVSKPKNSYEFEEGCYVDAEFLSPWERNIEDRVEGALRAAEKYTRLFLLYQRYFVGKNESLGIPEHRLGGDRLSPEDLQYHIRTLEMLEEIRGGKRESERLENFEGRYLPMYAHYPYIKHAVHI